MDHVHPKAKGGKLTWNNTVCACRWCNSKKSHLTLSELGKVGMKLRKLPYAPTYPELQMKSKHHQSGPIYEDWKNFMT